MAWKYGSTGGLCCLQIKLFEQQDIIDKDYIRKLGSGKMLLGRNAETNKIIACYRAV